MALVPHKITALAESDADGSDGKNIVAGAVVALFDTDGDAAILYDDEDYGNGSTAKQTDAVGQVVVYVEQGEYDEQVNGSIKRRVLVGGKGNDIVSYGTTAEIEALRPRKTGTRIENRERANAQYILRENGYTALPGDLTAANGRVWELQIEGKANVLWFGAIADWDGSSGTDNYDAFMDAKDRASHVFVPDGKYGYSQAIPFDKDNFVWECEAPGTLMYCTGSPAAWPLFGNVLLGTYNIPSIDSVTRLSLEPCSAGDTGVDLSTSGEASSFGEGDVVFVTSVERFVIGASDRPKWGEINIVDSTDGATIHLKNPLGESGDCEIINMSSNSGSFYRSDGTLVGDNFASKNVKILGGSWQTKNDEGPFCGTGGAINCVVDIHSTRCRNSAAYGNLYAHCEFNFNEAITRTGAVELAYASHNNTVNGNTISITDRVPTTTSGSAAIWMNESSKGNVIRVNRVNSSDFEIGSIVEFLQCRENTVFVGSVTGVNVTDSIIEFADFNYSGDRPEIRDNMVEITYSDVDTTNAIRHAAATSGLEINNSAKINSKGNTPDAIFWFNSESPKVHDSFISSGSIPSNVVYENASISNTFIQGGLEYSGNADDGSSLNTSNLTTERSLLLGKINASYLAKDAKLSSPFSISRVIPSGSFGALDRVNVALTSFISGASSTDQKSYLLQLEGNTVFNFLTNSNGVDVQVYCDITWVTSTAAIFSYAITSGGSVVSSGVKTVGGVDFNSASSELSLSVTPSNASDSINVRSCRIKAYSANAGEF